MVQYFFVISSFKTFDWFYTSLHNYNQILCMGSLTVPFWKTGSYILKVKNATLFPARHDHQTLYQLFLVHMPQLISIYKFSRANYYPHLMNRQLWMQTTEKMLILCWFSNITSDILLRSSFSSLNSRIYSFSSRLYIHLLNRVLHMCSLCNLPHLTSRVHLACSLNSYAYLDSMMLFMFLVKKKVLWLLDLWFYGSSLLPK